MFIEKNKKEDSRYILSELIRNYSYGLIRLGVGDIYIF